MVECVGFGSTHVAKAMAAKAKTSGELKPTPVCKGLGLRVWGLGFRVYRV